MPPRAKTRQRTAKTRTVPSGSGASDTGVFGTTLRSAEALSSGLLHAIRETALTAVRGAQEVGAEIGSTAVSAFRGSIRAAEEIGGDLGRITRGASEGAASVTRDVRGEVGRMATEAAQGAVHTARRAGAAAARMLGIGAPAPTRRPLSKVEGRGARPRKRGRQTTG